MNQCEISFSLFDISRSNNTINNIRHSETERKLLEYTRDRTLKRVFYWNFWYYTERERDFTFSSLHNYSLYSILDVRAVQITIIYIYVYEIVIYDCRYKLSFHNPVLVFYDNALSVSSRASMRIVLPPCDIVKKGSKECDLFHGTSSDQPLFLYIQRIKSGKPLHAIAFALENCILNVRHLIVWHNEDR